MDPKLLQQMGIPVQEQAPVETGTEGPPPPEVPVVEEGVAMQEAAPSSAPPEQVQQQEAPSDEAIEAALMSHFPITPEEGNRFITEPEKVLPRLLARAVKMGAEIAVQMQMQQLPAFLEQYNQQNEHKIGYRNEHPDVVGNPLLDHFEGVVRQTKPELPPIEVRKLAADLVRTVSGKPAPQKKSVEKPYQPAGGATVGVAERKNVGGALGVTPELLRQLGIRM